MANRFDQPAQHKFINTYTPIPFAELAAAGQARQGRLDENMGRLDAAQAAATNLKYIPNSQDEAYIRQVQDSMTTIADDYIDKDLSDPEIYRKLRSDIRSNVDQKRVTDIQNSQAAWAANQQNVAKLKASGDYRGEIDLDPSRQSYDTYSQGIYQHQTPGYIESRPIAEQYFNQLQPSSEVRKDPSSGYMAVYNVIDDDTIRQTAKENARNFIDTNAGQQAVQIARARGGEQYANMTDEQLATQMLYDVGKEKHQDRLQAFLPGQTSKKDKKGDTPGRVTFQQQGAVDQGKGDILGVGKAPSFDDNGQVKTVSLETKYVTPLGYMSPSVGPKDPEVSPEIIENTNKIVERFPELNRGGDATPEQIWKGYEQIQADFNQIATPSVKLTEAQRKAWGSQLADGLVDQHMELRDSRGVSKVASTVNDTERGSVMHELGYTPSEFKDALKDPNNSAITVANFSIGDGAEPGQMILNVADKKKKDKGTIRKVYISTNMGMEEEVQGLHDLYSMVSTGQDQLVYMGNEEGTNTPIGIQNVPQFTYDEKTDSWNYLPNLMMGPIGVNPATGEPAFIGEAYPVRYRDVAEETLGNMFSSGFLGSDLMDTGSPSATQ